MDNDSDYEMMLKRLARIGGFLVLGISAYFSYDGFDQNVGGGNASYTTLAKIIGVVMCAVMSLFQFVLSSRYDQLNMTLKMVGFASYIYSVWTTYMGAVNIMGMSNEMALAVALFFDIAPEPAIAWSFGDSLKGDLFGNLTKMVLGTGKKSKSQPQPQQQSKHQNNNQQGGGGKPKGFERRNELERQFQSGGGHHGQDRRGEKKQGPTTYAEMANRFHQEEE